LTPIPKVLVKQTKRVNMGRKIGIILGFTFFFAIMIGIIMFLTGTFQEIGFEWGSQVKEEGIKENSGEVKSNPENKNGKEKQEEPNQKAGVQELALISPKEAPIYSNLPSHSQNSPQPASTDTSWDTSSEQLARLYEAMRPQEVALILLSMDKATAANILKKMKERTAAKIMGAIAAKNPADAVEISKLFAKKGLP